MKKDSAAVTLGRKGGLKGGPARAARLTPEQRSASASKAVRARWAKAGKPSAVESVVAKVALQPSEKTLASLLTKLRLATDADEIRELSEKIEHVIFHRQFADA